MKKTAKVILSLVCVIAMIASLGIGAFAYTDAEIDALVRAELMGKKDLEAPMIEDEEDDEFDDLPLLGADEE